MGNALFAVLINPLLYVVLFGFLNRAFTCTGPATGPRAASTARRAIARIDRSACSSGAPSSTVARGTSPKSFT